MVALDKKESASLLLERIGEKLGGDEFQSTQGVAWALMAASRYLGDDKQFFTADYTMNSLEPTAIESDKPLFSSSLVATQDAALGIKNTGGIRLYASVISHGVPQIGDEKSLSKGLSIKTLYQDNKKDSELDWGSLPNGSKIAQGTDIKMTVYVSNDAAMDAEYLALTLPVAAGWEILNDLEQPKSGAVYDHKDLRDDRIHYYFDLKKGEEKTFSLVANASYLGQFYVPSINVEGMYDGNFQARERGKWVHIVKPDALEKEKPLLTKIIKSKRSKLYDGMSEAQVTKMFVIAGDKVTVLKEEKAADGKLWYFIRFNGRKVIERWIKADTVE